MDRILFALLLLLSLSEGVEAAPSQTAEITPDEQGASTPSGEQDKAVASSGQTNEPTSRRRPGAFLGFSLAAVSDLGENNQYKTLYGDEKRDLGFFAGYYLWTYGVDLGIAAKLGYYKATGNPVTGIDRSSLPIKGDLPESITVDRDQTMELSLLPIQILGNLAVSPFASRRVVLRGWFGPEWLYVQESVQPALPSTVSGEGNSGFVNKGWNQGTVLGAMLSISITGLEARSDYAMRSIGIDRTYISPYVEIVKTNNDKMGNFDRKNYGIAFNFESLR